MAKSKKLDAIVSATRELMLDAGYASVTYRGVAARAGVAPGLVQYYFPALDDLFIAVLRRGTDEIVARLTDAAATAQPLRTAWEYANDRTGTALLLEFMALANHRRPIGEVIGEGGERVRLALLENVSSKWEEYGAAVDHLSPAAVLFLMSAIPRMVHLEETFGTSTGHPEAIDLVERFLDRVEPRPVQERRPRSRA